MMRKFVGEYDECLKKLYGSLEKRFGLENSCCLEEIDRAFTDKEFLGCPIILISNDDRYSVELIEKINVQGDYLAYGFYRDSEFPYESVNAVREMIPKLIENNKNVFIYIGVDVRSYFRLEIPGTICIKQGKGNGQLSIDIIKTRNIVVDEIIRRCQEEDLTNFNVLLDEYYKKRWSKCPKLFNKSYKLGTVEFRDLCQRGSARGAIVAQKNEQLVGFLIYEYKNDCDNRAFENISVLTVTDIYVDSEFRRMGLATKMYEFLIRPTSKVKISEVRFKIWNEDEEACKFIDSLQAKELYTMYEVDV